MGATAAGILFAGSLILVLAAVHVPLGDHMYRTFTSGRHRRAERLVYRIIGVDPDAEQVWSGYARSVLAFSAVSVLALYGLQRLQGHLMLSLGFGGVDPGIAWNTAISFVTNTNWQAYSGESTMGHLVQMAGLAVQNFVSAAVGIAVAMAFVRGLARRRTGELGNFWVDLTRAVTRVLLPIAAVAAIVLVAGGTIQNFADPHTVTTLTGGKQTITGGPVASQEVIKELGTNGGGFYNVNSAHPFENPTSWTNWFEILLILLIPFSLPRTFGRMVGDRRQGGAIVAVMGVLALLSVILLNIRGRAAAAAAGGGGGTRPAAGGGRQDAHRAAQRRQPRPAHAAGLREGRRRQPRHHLGRLDAGGTRRTARHRRPVPRPARPAGREPARHEPPPGRRPRHRRAAHRAGRDHAARPGRHRRRRHRPARPAAAGGDRRPGAAGARPGQSDRQRAAAQPAGRARPDHRRRHRGPGGTADRRPRHRRQARRPGNGSSCRSSGSATATTTPASGWGSRWPAGSPRRWAASWCPRTPPAAASR